MSNKSIIIVTGASKGIGKAIAIALASDKHVIVCVSKSDQKGLLDTTETINEMGYSSYPILCDVSLAENVRQLYEEIALLKLPLETIINNAGVSLIKLLTQTTPEEWDYIIRNNLTSTYNMCYYGVPQMIQKQSGKIINISSIWGNDGASMEVAYSASKGGINAFTKALAKELGPSNIFVNALACGVIDTGMNQFLSEEEALELKDSISLGRYGTTKEVASMVKSILEHGSYLNGQVITLDGGRY